MLEPQVKPLETEEEEQSRLAMEMIAAVYKDGEAEINGRKYLFTKMTHMNRRKVFAFSSSVGEQIKRNNLSFLATPEFLEVEKLINNVVTFNGSLLSKISDHWDQFPQDFVPFFTTALMVISYPFLPGARID